MAVETFFSDFYIFKVLICEECKGSFLAQHRKQTPYTFERENITKVGAYHIIKDMVPILTVEQHGFVV